MKQVRKMKIINELPKNKINEEVEYSNTSRAKKVIIK
jgi:hypothetical protein